MVLGGSLTGYRRTWNQVRRSKLEEALSFLKMLQGVPKQFPNAPVRISDLPPLLPNKVRCYSYMSNQKWSVEKTSRIHKMYPECLQMPLRGARIDPEAPMWPQSVRKEIDHWLLIYEQPGLEHKSPPRRLERPEVVNSASGASKGALNHIPK